MTQERAPGHEYYDWASTDDLLRHMRDQHGLPLLTLVQLGAAYRDDSVHRAFHKEAHRLAGIVRMADERQDVREARLFLGSLAELTSKLLAEGETLAAAWAEQLAATVKEWIASPSDQALHERVRLAMLEFNELAGG